MKQSFSELGRLHLNIYFICAPSIKMMLPMRTNTCFRKAWLQTFRLCAHTLLTNASFRCQQCDFSDGLRNKGRLQYMRIRTKRNSVPDSGLMTTDPLWEGRVRRDQFRYLAQQSFAQGLSLLHPSRLIPACSCYARRIDKLRLHSNQRGILAWS